MITEFTGHYRPFSNFWYSIVYLPDDDLIYPTNEHAYQASKSKDINVRRTIQLVETPGQAKRLGKSVVIHPTFNRLKVMLHLQKVKYSHAALQQLLLSTGRQKLVEGNQWHDNFWGICFCQVCNSERAYENPELGNNWLGKLLMLVRLEIQIEKGIE